MGLVAWRGLWDRFAEPSSPEAYQRALLKRVPCLLDARATGTTASRLLASSLPTRIDVPVFVAVDHTDEIREVLVLAAGAALNFVDRSTAPPYAIVAIRSGALVRIGSYYPFPMLPARPGRSDESGGTVLFESGDVLLSEPERRRHARRLRYESSRRFAAASQTWANEVWMVSDLVEHRQLLAAQGKA